MFSLHCHWNNHDPWTVSSEALKLNLETQAYLVVTNFPEICFFLVLEVQMLWKLFEKAGIFDGTLGESMLKFKPVDGSWVSRKKLQCVRSNVKEKAQ